MSGYVWFMSNIFQDLIGEVFGVTKHQYFICARGGMEDADGLGPSAGRCGGSSPSGRMYHGIGFSRKRGS